ncbi:MAG: hypothetical protein ABW168_29240 [Sedimenticola sp.]
MNTQVANETIEEEEEDLKVEQTNEDDICMVRQHPYNYKYFDNSADGEQRIAWIQFRPENEAGAMEVGLSLGAEIQGDDLPPDFGKWYSWDRYRKNDCYVNVCSVKGQF